ncbi:hypothetical protein LOD99_7628 [Oopsacas minuta]|uniref:Uncharacterized protein n=1 Tax=Oopsacas minuta TaxID=111878 RepID=A0AAV7JNN7_9METZ|nr:hypothetical protein LOD99_7628 [Oopsacas minuta]
MPSRCNNLDRPCRRRRPSRYVCIQRSIACFTLLLALGLTAFIVGMVSYFAPPIEHPISAQAMDTRIIDVDQTECGDFEIRNGTELLDVNLYILYNMPIKQQGATFSDYSTFAEFTNTVPDHFTYSYYLLEGSTIDLTIHLNPLYGKVWMWVKLFVDKVDNVCHDNTLLTYLCNFEYQETCIISTITIPTDGQYYISFCYQSNESIFVSGNSTALVQKLVYKADQQNIREHCTAPCYEEIYHIGDYIMLTTSNVTGNVTWEDRIDYNWLCSDIRAVGIWISFIMLLGMFLVMLSVGFIVALCVVLCIRVRTESDETDLLIPSNDLGPDFVDSIPPPQYTVASENSLRAPPPYTELPDARTVQSDADK